MSSIGEDLIKKGANSCRLNSLEACCELVLKLTICASYNSAFATSAFFPE